MAVCRQHETNSELLFDLTKCYHVRHFFLFFFFPNFFLRPKSSTFSTAATAESRCRKKSPLANRQHLSNHKFIWMIIIWLTFPIRQATHQQQFSDDSVLLSLKFIPQALNNRRIIRKNSLKKIILFKLIQWNKFLRNRFGYFKRVIRHWFHIEIGQEYFNSEFVATYSIYCWNCSWIHVN